MLDVEELDGVGAVLALAARRTLDGQAHAGSPEEPSRGGVPTARPGLAQAQTRASTALPAPRSGANGLEEPRKLLKMHPSTAAFLSENKVHCIRVRTTVTHGRKCQRVASGPCSTQPRRALTPTRPSRMLSLTAEKLSFYFL